MAEMIASLDLPPPPAAPIPRLLFERLRIAHDHTTVGLRIRDLGKNVDSLQHAVCHCTQSRSQLPRAPASWIYE
eukprot:COSAG01_NODE_768_length_13739_cov_6.271334_8_plen_74_part_00